ncbi:SRPBCC family protein [Amycolatopsis jejuensis]|uniref:SRPBCC family protein n=1 Tax=Amycolatopsis jejuensis TaxID=330084 RepID=UPI0005243CF6|nr:SRPBCC family protein [Amycolatopsis jejuensis]
MTWDRISTRTLPVTPAALWDVLADVEAWPRWDPDLARVELHAPPAAGSAGFFHPSGRVRGGVHARIADGFTVTTWTPGLEIGLRQPVPLGHMDLGFALVPAPDGATALTQHVTLTGPLRMVMVQIIGRDVVRHFAEKCAALAQLATAADHPSR